MKIKVTIEAEELEMARVAGFLLTSENLNVEYPYRLHWRSKDSLFHVDVYLNEEEAESLAASIRCMVRGAKEKER